MKCHKIITSYHVRFDVICLLRLKKVRGVRCRNVDSEIKGRNRRGEKAHIVNARGHVGGDELSRIRAIGRANKMQRETAFSR